MSYLRRYAPLLTLASAIACLYLYDLNGVGVLDPDEPRYLAIGRAFATTGHWITPRLWGTPWFEKPPLLYWMTAVGTMSGWGPELSGRLPVALLSLCFLAVMYLLLRREFGAESALVSAALLATSAGWLAYSNLVLTDLPMAVFYSLAVLLALPLLRNSAISASLKWRFAAIGFCLGLAALAKGLVPLALAVPFIWFLRRFWRNWWIAVVACLVVALPWYVGVYLQNGRPFLEDFFWKHHFERLYSAALQHVQPWYFYLPVLFASLFPWTPLFGLLGLHNPSWDARRRFLASCFAFGFLLFSISLNKLPGYLLPLLPAAFALLGTCFESRRLSEISRLWLLACAVLTGLLPIIAQVLPAALQAGRLSSVSFGYVSRTELFYIAAPVAVALLARRSWAVPLLVLCVVSGGLYLKIVSYPMLDRSVSARPLWRKLERDPATVCDGGINRDWAFGLAFYHGSPYPPCGSGSFEFALRPQGHRPPSLQKTP